MPEGDTLRAIAGRLQVLVGQRVDVETPHPRAATKRIAERLDGLVLEAVEAEGKNLLLRFAGGHVLRSHLRMTGRWRVVPRGTRRAGLPWLVVRGAAHEAVLWNGPVLELDRPRRPLGPDILAEPPDLDGMVARLRAEPAREMGDAVLDQRLVAGIGNKWRAEALWESRVSPWLPVGETDLRAVLAAAPELMKGRPPARVYRRRLCPRCGTPIRSHPQGDAARLAYWCPTCQRGGREPES
jgi:endonuclease VIII